jgi:hypothetical protein
LLQKIKSNNITSTQHEKEGKRVKVCVSKKLFYLIAVKAPKRKGRIIYFIEEIIIINALILIRLNYHEGRRLSQS